MSFDAHRKVTRTVFKIKKTIDESGHERTHENHKSKIIDIFLIISINRLGRPIAKRVRQCQLDAGYFAILHPPLYGQDNTDVMPHVQFYRYVIVTTPCGDSFFTLGALPGKGWKRVLKGNMPLPQALSAVSTHSVTPGATLRRSETPWLCTEADVTSHAASTIWPLKRICPALAAATLEQTPINNRTPNTDSVYFISTTPKQGDPHIN